jgi:hypothetical protein
MCGRLGKCTLPCLSYRPRTLELLSYIRHFFVDAFFFQIPDASAANIRNKLGRTISTGSKRRASHRTCVSPRILVAILRESISALH